MIKVLTKHVDIVDCESDHDVEEFDSWEHVIEYLEEEYGEDINGKSIRDLDEGGFIKIEGDVWFCSYELVKE